mgnify:CR=1 FL=1
MTTMTTDARGRLTLGAKNTTYRVTTYEDGTMLFEPARVLTEAEYELLLNTDLRRQVEHSMSHPEEATPRRRRSGAKPPTDG